MAVENFPYESQKNIQCEQAILNARHIVLKNRVRSLLTNDGRYSESSLKTVLEMVAREAEIPPTKFHLGEKKWFDGVLLGPQQLFRKEGRQPIKMGVVFDCESKIFRFCERLEPIIAPVRGFELQGQDKQGHKLFFEEGTKDQQLGLLLKTLQIIFSIRIRSLQTEA
ncbi:MAG: hypothetical protein HYS83_00810 [Candidatus Blackburnbacteria bacterium]|nr:hypothetical protein [Candidatus Blackburnbacteria bacterium]